ARYVVYLSRINYKLIHKPGTSIRKVDVLSKREDHANSIKDDNKGVTLIDQSSVSNVRIRQGHNLLRTKLEGSV
ncbi:hypothetical protein SERLADRAFT_345174, partial [Serpula lacrymans var. lacrymans S7.9]